MRRWLVGLAILGIVIAVSPQADARVFVGVGVGVPIYAPPPIYYYPPPPPVYYVPPPVVYAPPPPAPVYVAPQPAPASTAPSPPPSQTGNCRQYRGDATIDGRNQPFYGTACLQPDGRWHIVH